MRIERRLSRLEHGACPCWATLVDCNSLRRGRQRQVLGALSHPAVHGEEFLLDPSTMAVSCSHVLWPPAPPSTHLRSCTATPQRRGPKWGPPSPASRSASPHGSCEQPQARHCSSEFFSKWAPAHPGSWPASLLLSPVSVHLFLLSSCGTAHKCSSVIKHRCFG